MNFRDVIGQEEVKRHLRLSVTEGRIPHAQLFTGAAGAGKLPLALAYAQYIACPHRTAGDSCGVCPTCRQFQALQHPDLHFAFPIVKTDSGDTCNDFMAQWRRQLTTQPYFDLDDWYRTLGVETKQGIIYDKESSEILRKLSLKSFADGYKFMLIWLPEKMNASCANKLLKLLEEPPEKTLFLLVSEQPELLLSTIVSRTQEIRVPRLTEGDIAAELTRSRGIGGTEAQDLAHIANGSLTAAYKLADENEQNTLFFNDFVALMRNAWLVGKRKDYSALLSLRKWSLDMADAKVGRERQKAFLQYAQRQVRENYIANYHCPGINYQTTAERTFSAKFAPFINNDNVERIMTQLGTAEAQITQNGNAKIIFFDLCLQMIVLIKN